jgi:hypothetical protein
MSRPSSGSTCYMFHAGFLLDVFFDLEDATCSSETSFEFQWTARRYITEDSNLRGKICERYFCFFICMYIYVTQYNITER